MSKDYFLEKYGHTAKVIYDYPTYFERYNIDETRFYGDGNDYFIWSFSGKIDLNEALAEHILNFAQCAFELGFYNGRDSTKTLPLET